MYPTPVWGRADVPGYDAGPFVRSGYQWTARTTELHPDGECMHRPPRGETPGGGTTASVGRPPPPNPRAKGHTKRAQPGAQEHGGEKGRARGVRSCVVRSVVQPYANGKRDGPVGEQRGSSR